MLLGSSVPSASELYSSRGSLKFSVLERLGLGNLNLLGTCDANLNDRFPGKLVYINLEHVRLIVRWETSKARTRNSSLLVTAFDQVVDIDDITLL